MMPRGPRLKSSTGIYHIIYRGANRQEIFHDEEDFQTFLDTLKKYKLKAELTVFGWSLMSNHIHLLLKEGSESISVTMQRISVSYASYYNWKYRTTGHLYEDRFKSENVEDVAYFLTVIRYIHQNPLKARMVSCMEDWKWSSCLGYYDMNLYPSQLLNKEFILRMFASDMLSAKERFREFNEKSNHDQCLEAWEDNRWKFSDDEAREEIKRVLGPIKIPQVKTLPKLERDQLLRQLKGINGLTQRQMARILGVSPNLIFKA